MGPLVVDTLRLALTHKDVEPREEASPTGVVPVEHGSHRAVLLTPARIDPDRRYPLFTVLHGAGRQDEMLARAYQSEPENRQALFLIPRSLQMTWDLIVGGGRTDLDFLAWAWDLIYRRYPIDPDAQALIGYSDGASYALSVGLSNPHVFSAVLGWAAGFKVIEAPPPDAPKPRVLLEYGTADELFPFDQVALPMRDDLEGLGYDVAFLEDRNGRHWPRGDFHCDALDWFFTGELPD